MLLVLLLVLLLSAVLVAKTDLWTVGAECGASEGAAIATTCMPASEAAAWLGQGVLTVASLSTLLGGRLGA